MEKHIAAIPKNTSEAIHVDLQEFKGTELVSIRVHFKQPETGEMLPTKKGIAVRVGLLDALIDALQQARFVAQSAGLSTPALKTDGGVQ